MILWLLSVALAADPALSAAVGEVTTTYAVCQIKAEVTGGQQAIVACQTAKDAVYWLSKLLVSHPEWPESATLPPKVAVYERNLERALVELRGAQASQIATAPLTNEGGHVVTIEQAEPQYDIALHFTKGSTEIRPADIPIILDVCTFSASQEPPAFFEVQGHSDSRGSARRTLESSVDRAEAVADALTECGVLPDHIRVVAYGEERPIAPNNTAEGRHQNRRVEITLQGLVPDAPDMGL